MRKAARRYKDKLDFLSRQQRYRVRHFRLGMCINCGKEKGESKYKKTCMACGEKRRLARKRARRELKQAILARRLGEI